MMTKEKVNDQWQYSIKTGRVWKIFNDDTEAIHHIEAMNSN